MKISNSGIEEKERICTMCTVDVQLQCCAGTDGKDTKEVTLAIAGSLIK